MTLSSALTVAFAVRNGAPSDVREWVSVELAEFLASGRRGFMVVTEAVRHTPESDELAVWVREIIVAELRRQYQLAPDAAIGRAFAAANGAIHERMHEMHAADGGEKVQIGATAVIFDGHLATIGHVPPGQLILVEDGLVYAIPDLQSWLPHYTDSNSGLPNPEPLGFGPRVAPVIAQTDLRAGDTLVLCTTACGEAFGREMSEAGVASPQLEFMHGRDPDKILDAFRDLIAEHGLPDAAVAVLGFAPLRDGKQIRTLGDVGRRTKDNWRRAKGATLQLLPQRSSPDSTIASLEIERASVASAARPASATEAGSSKIEGTPAREPVSNQGLNRNDHRREWRARSLRIAERVSPSRESTWTPPSHVQQFGVPGAHGVRAYRGAASDMGEEGWRNHLPRMPFGGTFVWGILCLLLIAAVLGAAAIRERVFVSTDDFRDHLVQVDRNIQEARDLTDPAQIDTELGQAQDDLDAARSAGAPSSDIDPRQQTIIDGLDQANNVLRLDDVTRIGGLPDQLQQEKTRITWTPGGVFLVDGSLYHLQSDGKVVDRVLEKGSTLEGTNTTIGDLFGVAYDTEGLYATDGINVFVYSADNAWHVVKLNEINEQGPWKSGPVGAFDSNLYILEAEYRNIYRFDTNPDNASTDPVDWVQPGDRLVLSDAVDMTIDGQIYVLLEDGRVLTLYRGAVADEIELPHLGQGKVVAIANGPATGYLYVAVIDGSSGRIVAFDHTGEYVYQLELPAGFTTQGVDVRQPFEGLQDFAVDENSGVLYLVSQDAVWSARYELPALPQPAGTPVATPAN